MERDTVQIDRYELVQFPPPLCVTEASYDLIYIQPNEYDARIWVVAREVDFHHLILMPS